MRVISFIEDEEVIKKTLKASWPVGHKNQAAPKATGPPKVPEYSIDSSLSQLPASDKWLYVDPEPAYT